MVLDPSAFDARVKIIAKVFPVVTGELAVAEEGRDLIGFDNVDRGAGDGLIDASQVALPVEDDIRRVLRLHDAPVVGDAECPDDGTVRLGESVESPVKSTQLDRVGELLSRGEVFNPRERVVQDPVGDVLCSHLRGQQVVTVEVELEAEGTPCGDAQIAEAKLRIDEVEIVVDAFSGVGAQKCPARLLVVPRLVGGACLHRREDVNEARVTAALCENLLNPALLAHRCRPDELDLDARRLRQTFGVGPDLIAKWLGKSRIVEDADMMTVQVGCHPLRMAQTRKRPLDNDAVVA